MTTKSALIIGLFILIGLISHSLITQSCQTSSCDPPASNEISSSEWGKDGEAYHDYNDVREYMMVGKLKQSMVDQLSDLEAKVMNINGKDYVYVFWLDENENGKGINWEHALYSVQGDSTKLIELEMPE